MFTTTTTIQLLGPVCCAIRTWRSFRRATCSRRCAETWRRPLTSVAHHVFPLPYIYNVFGPPRSNQISIKREAHLKKYPDAKVISLGIGDTTEPIPSVVTSAMAEVFLFFCELRFFLITLLPSFSAEHEHACMHARESLSQCKAAWGGG